MTETQRNLELKVACGASELAAIRQRLDSLTCEPLQRLHQVDTYFTVNHGRLKLREIRSSDEPKRVERAELIAYARPDGSASRWSEYRVVPTPAHLALDLLGALLMTHDRLSLIEKIRHVGLIGQTRIHLDEVVDLGCFVELETVVTSQSVEDANAEHNQVIASLGLGQYPAIAGSYSDLAVPEA